MPQVEITWLGHAAFRIDSPNGKRIYLDPWLRENPSCPDSEKTPERVDVIALTHGHGDHVGDTVSLWQQFKPKVLANFELRSLLAGDGVEFDMDGAVNKGGAVELEGIRFTMTDARHSSSYGPSSLYAGEPAGYVIELPNGLKVYAAGDTCVFGDMELIATVYEPDVAILPIGDHFTMGPREAAVALALLGVRRCIPGHWGTFPALTGTPAMLRELAPDVEVIELAPGGTVAL